MITASVIIPTYNYGRYICEAVSSVLAQTYSRARIEIIVVDDGSTDNTRAVLETFIQDGSIQYHWQANKGKANATNFGIQLCQGEYIFNLDADDYFLPEKIEEFVRVFEAYPNVVHVGSPATFFNQETQASGAEEFPADLVGKPINGNALLRRFYRDNILFGGGSTYAARSSALRAVRLDDAFDMYIDELLILAVLLCGDSYLLAHPLSVWRIHQSNYSGAKATQEQQRRKAERLLRSSGAILAYVEAHKFEEELRRIYRLKHATRTMAFAEAHTGKSLNDILRYARQVFVDIRPSWHVVRKYHVLNRLIPAPLFRALKKMKKTQ